MWLWSLCLYRPALWEVLGRLQTSELKHHQWPKTVRFSTTSLYPLHSISSQAHPWRKSKGREKETICSPSYLSTNIFTHHLLRPLRYELTLKDRESKPQEWWIGWWRDKRQAMCNTWGEEWMWLGRLWCWHMQTSQETSASLHNHTRLDNDD